MVLAPFRRRSAVKYNEPSFPARRPCAGARAGPVRDLLVGETSPAALLQQRITSSVPGLLRLRSGNGGAPPPRWAVSSVLGYFSRSTEQPGHIAFGPRRVRRASSGLSPGRTSRRHPRRFAAPWIC